MVLKIELNRFAAEVRARTGQNVAYVSKVDGRTLATAGTENLTIVAQSNKTLDEVQTMLGEAGLELHRGQWGLTLDDVRLDDEPLYVYAVAYRSEESRPGLWVDAGRLALSPSEVIERMFEEMRTTGELGEVTYEDFVNVLGANVVVLTPDQLERFARRSG